MARKAEKKPKQVRKYVRWTEELDIKLHNLMLDYREKGISDREALVFCSKALNAPLSTIKRHWKKVSSVEPLVETSSKPSGFPEKSLEVITKPFEADPIVYINSAESSELQPEQLLKITEIFNHGLQGFISQYQSLISSNNLLRQQKDDLNSQLESLQTTNEALNQRYQNILRKFEDLNREYANLLEDHHAILGFIDRARELALKSTGEDVVQPKKFRMEPNGNLEIVE